jgi:hypothetical protein
MLEAQLADVQASIAALNAVKNQDAPPGMSCSEVGTRFPATLIVGIPHVSPVYRSPAVDNTPIAAKVTYHDSDMDSGSSSDTDAEDSAEDPLRDRATQAPLRDMINAVASTEKVIPAGHQTPGLKRPIERLTPSDTRSRKRSRPDSVELRCAELRARVLPLTRGTFSCLHLDPVSCGILSEKEAERLFTLYVTLLLMCSYTDLPGSSPSVTYICPCLMRAATPWTGKELIRAARRPQLKIRVRQRSAFCFSTILTVAKVAEDPGGKLDTCIGLMSKVLSARCKLDCVRMLRVSPKTQCLLMSPDWTLCKA